MHSQTIIRDSSKQKFCNAKVSIRLQSKLKKFPSIQEITIFDKIKLPNNPSTGRVVIL